jgi:transcription initiation factor TFIIE subunit alpha
MCFLISEKKSLDSVLKKVLEDFGGKEALKIAKVLHEMTEEVTDESLAEVSKVKLNIVRKILYILNENKLTEFRRVRDKRSGWFVYFWSSNFDKLGELLKERRNAVIEKLETRMNFENDNYFFVCTNTCKERYVFINAMEYNFKCPKCGKDLVEEVKDTKVKFLTDTIVKLRNQ